MQHRILLLDPPSAGPGALPSASLSYLGSMNKLPPFFVIGSVGLVITALLHIGLALVLGLPGVHGVFIALYPFFLAFLALGFGQLLRPIPVRRKR